MRLLVTGGNGFIASHFINSFGDQLDEVKIVNIDAMYYCASQENVLHKVREHPNYTFVRGDINSCDLVNHVLKTFEITHVAHFAAQSHVQNSFDDSFQFTKDNVMGTHSLLECCRQYGKVERFIHVSTDEVYGETGDDQKTEQSLLCPTNPYAATKAAAELIARSYLHSYGLPVIVTRGNNVYGPNQYPEKLIPRFITLLRDSKKLTVHGNGTALRAFLHVSDTVAAFRLILDKGSIGATYNIGCDEGMELSVLDVAKKLVKKVHGTDRYEDYIEYVKDRPFNDQRYYISNDKLKALGWEISVDFNEGIAKLVNIMCKGNN